jgi:hypothetical protein
MTTTSEPIREGDTITALFHEREDGPTTVTGKVVRLFPESRTMYLQADDGYYPLHMADILLHIPARND